MDQWTLAEHTGVRGEESRREIIGAVDDEVIPCDEVGGVFDREAFGVQGHLEAGVDLTEGFGRGNRLRQT